MFFTQWNAEVGKREHSGKDTLVSLVPCMSNQERIAQGLLTGSLVQAANTGYDIRDDEKIMEVLFDVQKRNLDIVDRLEAVQLVRQKVDAYIKGKLNEKTDKMANEFHSESEAAVSDKKEPEGEV